MVADREGTGFFYGVNPSAVHVVLTANDVDVAAKTWSNFVGVMEAMAEVAAQEEI